VFCEYTNATTNDLIQVFDACASALIGGPLLKIVSYESTSSIDRYMAQLFLKECKNFNAAGTTGEECASFCPGYDDALIDGDFDFDGKSFCESHLNGTVYAFQHADAFKYPTGVLVLDLL